LFARCARHAGHTWCAAVAGLASVAGGHACALARMRRRSSLAMPRAACCARRLLPAAAPLRKPWMPLACIMPAAAPTLAV